MTNSIVRSSYWVNTVSANILLQPFWKKKHVQENYMSYLKKKKKKKKNCCPVKLSLTHNLLYADDYYSCFQPQSLLKERPTRTTMKQLSWEVCLKLVWPGLVSN